MKEVHRVDARGEAAVEVAAGERQDLARVEPEGKRYFRPDDGTPLFLKGLCACRHGRRGTYDYDDGLAAHEKAGINYIRIWMWHQAFGIEWDKGDQLHYRLDNAWRLDQVLVEAEPSPVEDAKVSLTGVSNGVWSVEWRDTLAGTRLAAAKATASGGVLPLPAPASQVDIAARLQRH